MLNQLNFGFAFDGNTSTVVFKSLFVTPSNFEKKSMISSANSPHFGQLKWQQFQPSKHGRDAFGTLHQNGSAEALVDASLSYGDVLTKTRAAKTLVKADDQFFQQTGLPVQHAGVKEGYAQGKIDAKAAKARFETELRSYARNHSQPENNPDGSVNLQPGYEAMTKIINRNTSK